MHVFGTIISLTVFPHLNNFPTWIVSPFLFSQTHYIKLGNYFWMLWWKKKLMSPVTNEGNTVWAHTSQYTSHQSCRQVHVSFQLKAEQINKITTIFTQNDHFFQTWPFWLKKINLLSMEQKLFLSHLEIKRGKNRDSIETKFQWQYWYE